MAAQLKVMHRARDIHFGAARKSVLCSLSRRIERQSLDGGALILGTGVQSHKAV